jgi:hypothetical protein
MPRSSIHAQPSPSLSVAAMMSFLKETRGMLTWTIKDLQQSLLVTTAEAQDAIAALQILGYIKPADGSPNEWVTTIAGETVSGSKMPRFDRQRVETSLASLRERIKFLNADTHSPYRVVRAVGFGDFLSARARAQAADAAIELARQGKHGQERETKTAFIKRLRARDLKINLVPYESWMSGRSHRKVL